MSSAFRFPAGALALFSVLIACPVARALDFTTPYYFTTLAGTASEGSVDGPLANARFYAPTAVTVDPAGNVYIMDGFNYSVRKITPAGIVSTLAGTPSYSGTLDGTGPNAHFDWSLGIAADPSGNLYVAETFGFTIRKVTASGVVTTLAGIPGTGGATDGTGPAARFNNSRGIVVGPSGDIFVADGGGGTIRKITPGGVVTTLAGGAGLMSSRDGQGSAANFSGLFGLAVDASGTLYATDEGGIRKITPAGNVTTLVGTRMYNPAFSEAGSENFLYNPWGLAFDSAGNLYVSDQGRVIKKITPAGAVTLLAGNPGGGPEDRDGTGREASFTRVYGLAVDAGGNVYAAESWNNTIRKITPAGVVTTFGVAPEFASGHTDAAGSNARFRDPDDTAVDGAGNLYVADTGNHAIRRVTADGNVSTFAGAGMQPGNADGTGPAARFNKPRGLALDASGNLYVSDSGNAAIRKITPAAVVTTLATGVPGRGLTLNAAGEIFVADPDGGVVRKVAPNGAVSVVGGPTFPGGSFNLPTDVAADATGNLYVTDSQNHVIRKIAGGSVSTFAGRLNFGSFIDGAADTAAFALPSSLAIDGPGNLYVADKTYHLIRKITPAGVVSSLGGGSGGYQRITGFGRDARLVAPRGISAAATGIIYFIDDQTIRKGELGSAPVIVTQPQSQSVSTGSSAQFSVVVSGAPAPAYQWYFNGSPFQGATGSRLSFNNALSTDSGDYTVVITNALGNVTSSKATLTVSAASSPPPNPGGSSGGGGGGGGSPSLWFVAALLVLFAWRQRK